MRSRLPLSRSFSARSLAGLGCLVALSGCQAAVLPAAAFGAADLASVTTFHRSTFDLVYSAATGQDCSIVRLDKGQRYCKPKEAPPPAQPYCTRSLGAVDCWADPQAVPNLPAEVADGPRSLTREQEQQRTARWPDL